MYIYVEACQSSKYVLAGEFVEFRNSNGIGVHCKYNNNPEIINNGELKIPLTKTVPYLR